MPELPDTMYCSEQICIPPAFPYMLRQYAKAAIRTQPTDLLRWSTAYFRCLSLNLKPPVKLRLEYPIPKSHFGLTPGWLKALLHQLENNLTVSFKVLWDRWIGACMEHKNLIEVLCLAGFTDPQAIPWFRFLAISAAYLTESLTQTMILVCEILTEEPEGGCAMIPLETFVDVYKFLAAIDASQPQTLINIYFVDSLLSLYREPIVEKAKESITIVEEEVEEESVVEEEAVEVEEDTGPVDDQIGVVISCPDIAPDDYKTEEYFLQLAEEGEGDEDEKQEDDDNGDDEISNKKDEPKPPEESITDVAAMKSSTEGLDNLESVTSVDKTEAPQTEAEEVLEQELHVEELALAHEEDEEGFGEDEGTGYMDQELEELKQLLESPEIEGEEEKSKEEELPPIGEEVFVDAIPGIGGIVSSDMVEAVIRYMEECAKIQHGMVMPRNVRHFNCPPLEHLEY